MKTLTNIFNGIKSKNLDAEFKVGWIYDFDVSFSDFLDLNYL